MSDTPDELRDAIEPMLYANGRVLVNGLGLGCSLIGMLQLREGKLHNGNGDGPFKVVHVDVVERSLDVIEIIRPYLPEDRVTFWNEDALEIKWPTGTRGTTSGPI